MACELWPYDITCLPSGWPVDPGDTVAELVAAMTPAQRTSYDFAVGVLADLTLRKFGLCEQTVRPCSMACGVGFGFALGGGGWFTPVLHGGQVYNTCGCASVSSCGCGDTAAVLRLDGPVAEVLNVHIDGVVVDPDLYRVDNGTLLVRTDGGAWPLRQNLNAPVGDDGTFDVQYMRGTPLPAGGRRAVSALMVEFDKARCGDNTCQLPARVTNVVREGVTYTMLDNPIGLLDAGRTGIPDVDVWLSAVNPYGMRSPMRVYSPDLARRRVLP